MEPGGDYSTRLRKTGATVPSPVTPHGTQAGYPRQPSRRAFTRSAVGHAIDSIDLRLAALGRHLVAVERPLEAAGVVNIRRQLFEAQATLAIIEVVAET